ncbi:hypothetical protein G6O67_007010 [Ophiocordyceps sinensis]|uniref:Basic proline-rich protein n=1 Tax=Ophiocordyceps sinensis TaxID=72228 RepID=A0A8H4PHX9_9HYPO|nr:hypothetical protein G6O67_007010 [Ophiocordyceps sinensis]
MEPVPETERMEEFKSWPVPSVRLGAANHDGRGGVGGGNISDDAMNGKTVNNNTSDDAINGNTVDNNTVDDAINEHDAAVPILHLDLTPKPPTLRRSTEPSPSSPVTPSWASASAPYRPPLSGSHSRSLSATGLAMPMSRTQSMPGLGAAGRIMYSPQLLPASPSGSPRRLRTPRKPVDDVFPAPSPVRASVHDAEPRPTCLSDAEGSGSPGQASPTPGSMARHRRPPSPLGGVALPGASSLALLPSTPSSTSSVSPMRAYDALSGFHSGSLSSVPSTPTSTRSRSPSISSLETIPDSPDAEEAALEAERLAQLKAAAEAADGLDSSDAKTRNAGDVPARGRTMNFGSRDKRKRWSVCGAERRGDIDLETIWED